jgi:hypothetical protein
MVLEALGVNSWPIHMDNITQPKRLNSGAEFDAAPGRFGCQLQWVRVG